MAQKILVDDVDDLAVGRHDGPLYQLEPHALREFSGELLPDHVHVGDGRLAGRYRIRVPEEERLEVRVLEKSKRTCG